MADKPANKVCESCGAEFGCGARLDGCWCTKLTLNEIATADIPMKFIDCLCPACLGKFADILQENSDENN